MLYKKICNKSAASIIDRAFLWVGNMCWPPDSPSVPVFPCATASQGPHFLSHKGGTVSPLSPTVSEGECPPSPPLSSSVLCLRLCVSLCFPLNDTGIKSEAHFTTPPLKQLQRQPLMQRARLIVNNYQRPLMPLYLKWCWTTATESWLPSSWQRLISQNCCHWPVTERMMMGNLCFPFDSRCFLFSSASHFLVKPAVLISDTDVCRAPQSR